MPKAGDVVYFPSNIVEFKAGADISKGQMVRITGEWEVQATASDDHVAIGIALNDAKSGEKLEVLIMKPVVYVTYDGSITAGDELMPSGTTAGRVTGARKQTTVGTYTEQVCGVAIEGGGAGDVRAMVMVHYWITYTV